MITVREMIDEINDTIGIDFQQNTMKSWDDMENAEYDIQNTNKHILDLIITVDTSIEIQNSIIKLWYAILDMLATDEQTFDDIGDTEVSIINDDYDYRIAQRRAMVKDLKAYNPRKEAK